MNAGRSHRGVGAALLALALDPAREAAARILDGVGHEGFFVADDWELLGVAVLASRLAGLPLDPVLDRASRAISSIAPRRGIQGGTP